MTNRYQARFSTTTGNVVVIDTRTQEVIGYHGVTAYAMRQARQHAADLNQLDEVHDDDRHLFAHDDRPQPDAWETYGDPNND